MSDVVHLTYDELAQRLGITRESARQLVIRRRWGRTKGNDGKSRVSVPEEVLQARTADATDDDTGTLTPPDTSEPTSHATGDDTSALQVLTRHIERLEREVETLGAKLTTVEEDRDRERARASQVDALNAVLEIERKRAEELKAERDRWSAAAEAFQAQTLEMSRRPQGFLGWLRRA